MKRILTFLVLCMVVLVSCSNDLEVSNINPENEPHLNWQFSENNSALLTEGGVWGFVVDTEDGLVLSSEQNGEIYLSDYELETEPTWQRVISKEDIGGPSIVDHWHVYDGAYHWIAFSTVGDQASFIAKLSSDFELLELESIPVNTETRTNDLILVVSDQHVNIGHFKPGFGHEIYQFDLDLNFIKEKDLGGADFSHTNGASAYTHEEGYVVYAPETLSPKKEGGILKITTDDDWNPTSSTLLVQEDEMQMAMPTVLELEDGSWIMTVRLIDTHVYNESTSIIQDDGEIILYWFDQNDELLARRVLDEEGNRPHSLLWENKIITTWDFDQEIWVNWIELKE